MAISRKRLVTSLSVVYLLALSVLGAYALRSSHQYSLPIADVVSALAIALPTLAGVALQIVISINEKLAEKGQLQTSRIFQVVVAFFLVFESALAAIAGTHISPPGSLDCALRETWQKMYARKDATQVRRIQDAFKCCGLGSMKDMAWPFPDANHQADACMVRYEERNRECLGPWRDEERKVAIMLLVIPVAVFLWKVAVVLSPSSSSSWLPSQIRLPTERSSSPDQEHPTMRRPRLAIGGGDLESTGEDDSIRREIEGLNKDSRTALHVESQRAKSSGYLEHNRWRDSDD